MDARVRHEVGLELGDVHVEGAVEAERRSERGDALGDQAVQVGVGRALDVEVAAADVVDGLVVERSVDVHVLEESVHGQNRVVRLHNSSRDLRRRDDGKAELGLLAVVHRQALAQQSRKTRSRATTDGVEDHEALETSAVVRKLADAVKHEIDNLLANRVVTTGEVVGGVFLAGDELLRMEQLAVGAGTDLVDDGRLEINEDAARNVLASTSLREEGVEGVIAATDGLVRRHLAVRLDAVLEAEKLPAGVTHLATALTHHN
mmetsp:Transcript_28147/g.58705  ORF Transcript_28147/g.58705 Transcript_28147/m.58705 type:complete len:261 (-) Transcript_28147:83-865(-)